MLRAVIVEDEKVSLNLLDVMLKNTGKVEVVGDFTNAEDAQKTIPDLKPDVAFLDIEMPGMNGLELAEYLYSSDMGCEIVFVTACNNCAIDAFRVNALDYVLKPIKQEELMRAVDRVEKRQKKQDKGNKVIQSNEWNLNVSMFGNFKATIGPESRKLSWTTVKCIEMFSYLLLKAKENEVSKWKLIEALWPEKDEEKGYINLRSTVSRLNKTLREYETDASVVVSRTGYKLKATNIAVDVDMLEEVALAVSAEKVCKVEELESVVQNYAGELLEEFDSYWCDEIREKYHRYFHVVSRELLKHYRESGKDPVKTMETVKKIIETDPYDEDAHELFLELLYKVGGKREAQAHYKELHILLQEDHDVEPRETIKKFMNSI